MAIDKEPPELGPLRDNNILWRVSAWGGAATLALAAAVLMTLTDTGSRRLQMAFAPEAVQTRIVAQADFAPAPPSPPPNKEAEALRQETLRLQAQLRELTADRDRLSARVASVERNLSDMTGSIKRELALVAATAPAPVKAAAAPPPAVSAPQTAPPTAKPEANPQTQPAAKSAAAEPAAAAEPPARGEQSTAVAKSQARIEPQVDTTVLPKVKGKGDELVTTRIATNIESRPLPQPDLHPQSGMAPIAQVPTEQVPMPPARVAAIEPKEVLNALPEKPELGIDLGGAHSLQILHARWAAVKANFGPLIEGLHPLMARDRRPKAVPYRLLVGPLPNGAAAAQMCARFAASKVSCRTTKFVGEQLAH